MEWSWSRLASDFNTKIESLPETLTEREDFNEILPPDEELLDNMQLADLQRVLQSASSDSAQARYKILITSYFVSNHLTSGQQSRVLDVLKQLALIDTNNSWTTPDNDRPTLLWDINGI